jgi:hypothetical protein
LPSLDQGSQGADLPRLDAPNVMDALRALDAPMVMDAPQALNDSKALDASKALAFPKWLALPKVASIALPKALQLAQQFLQFLFQIFSQKIIMPALLKKKSRITRFGLATTWIHYQMGQ